MARKIGLDDSYSDDDSLPSIPDYNPGGDDFSVMTTFRSDADYQREQQERGLHRGPTNS